MVDRAPGDDGELLSTHEVTERTGLSRQVLYQYAAMGLIQAAGTTPAGQRLFTPRVLEHLKVIKALKESGYPLKEIKEIFFRRARSS
ncbi:MAG: MerR family transcriptional regulator [Planctomycetes bacterium]|nr:MerR family transcriptional regulator [Planctomycetota bacterium]